MSILSKHYKRIERQYGKQLEASAKRGSPQAEDLMDKIKIHKEATKKNGSF